MYISLVSKKIQEFIESYHKMRENILKKILLQFFPKNEVLLKMV